MDRQLRFLLLAGMMLPLLTVSNGQTQRQPANMHGDVAAVEDMESVPPVFLNGAWQPTAPGPLNAYVAALLSKDVYYKHVVDPRDGPRLTRNFTLFATMFCASMAELGADDCEAVSGFEGLIWALVRAGPSVLLVARGSNSPQNWITDLKSLRTTNVGDFGGGARGTNVAAGFYRVFAANRRSITDRVRRATTAASAAAESAKIEAPAGGAVGDGGAPAPRLWVLGHSLGGAVALMAATYLQRHEGLPVTGVYVYGCPRVGDSTWAKAYPLHKVTQRYENTGDIIPTLPFGPAWRHVGSSATIAACRALPQMAPPAGDEGQTASAGEAIGDPVFEAAMTEKKAQQGANPDAAEEEEEEGVDGRGGGHRGGDDGGAGTLVVFRAGVRPAATAVSRRLLRGGAAVTTDRGSATAAAKAADVGIAAVASALPQPRADKAHIAEEEKKKQEQGLEEGTFGLGDEAVAFPFPFSIRDHMVQTYVRVMWTCLPADQEELVPGPEDVYGPHNVSTIVP